MQKWTKSWMDGVLFEEWCEDLMESLDLKEDVLH